MTDVYTLRAEITLDQKELDFINELLSMAGDEILMGDSSSLGPIDAQVVSNGKRFSADAFLDGLEKIKREVAETGKLNPAYKLLQPGKSA